MTTWKPGDRFRLECEGEVKTVDPRDGYYGSVEVTTSYGYLNLPLALLDAHATKIRPRFKFGDRVRVRIGDEGSREGIVVLDQLTSTVKVWIRGDFLRAFDLPEGDLTLVGDYS